MMQKNDEKNPENDSFQFFFALFIDGSWFGRDKEIEIKYYRGETS